MRRTLVPLLLAALLGGPAVSRADEASCPASVLDVRGTNPSPRVVAGYLAKAAAAHGVPVQVLKAIAFQESAWLPFRDGGRPKISEADAVCGIGLMQITLGSRTDGVKLAADVSYNAHEGAKILRQKWHDGLNQTHPQPAGFDPDDPDVLENWYAAICRYNGCSFTATGDQRYARPVSLLVRSAFQAGVPSAIGQHMPPAGFTLPEDADPDYVFPGGFQAQHDPVEQFVFYDGSTGAVTKTAPAPTHLASTVFPGYGAAYGPGGPNVSCGGAIPCAHWDPAEGYGIAGWAHTTDAVAGAGSNGIRVTWTPPATGQYDVRAYVPSLGAQPLAKATYHFGTASQTVDQDLAKGTWADLGRRSLSAATPVWLGDGSDAGGAKIVADAVRLAAVSALAVTPSVRTVTYGRSTTLTLKVTQVGGGGLPYRRVVLEKRKVGVLGWTPVGAYTTRADGTVPVTATPAANTYYRVSNSSDDATVAAAPAVARVDVRPRVAAALSKTTVARGTSVRVSATVTPAHAGQQVRLQRYYSGGWHDALPATLSGTSTASWTFAKAAGTYRYRVSKPADSDHVAGWSPTLTLTVT